VAPLPPECLIVALTLHRCR